MASMTWALYSNEGKTQERRGSHANSWRDHVLCPAQALMEHARFYSDDMPRAAAISMTIGKLHPGHTIPEHKAHEHPETGTGNPVYMNQRQERPFCQSPHKRKTTTASPKRQWPSNHSASPPGCWQRELVTRSSAYSKGLIHGAPCSLSRATAGPTRYFDGPQLFDHGSDRESFGITERISEY